MPDLKRATADLVQSATSEVDPKVLRPKVEALLAAFDGAAKPGRLTAVKAIGTALGKVEGRGAQVLALALGALVEEGASAEAAWPAASKNLSAILEQATAFAHAVATAARDNDLESAMSTAGPMVAAMMPAEGEAWKAVPARCLAAVACLARSKEARIAARKEKALAESAWELSDAIAEVGALLHALRVLDDVTILVVAPETKKGWKISVEGISTNAELYLLIGELLEQKVDAKVVAALRAGEAPKKKSVTLPFTFGVDPEELASELPRHGKSKEHVLFLRKGSTTIDTAHFPVLDGLAPAAHIESALTAATVAKLTPRSPS